MGDDGWFGYGERFSFESLSIQSICGNVGYFLRICGSFATTRISNNPIDSQKLRNGFDLVLIFLYWICKSGKKTNKPTKTLAGNSSPIIGNDNGIDTCVGSDSE